MNKRIYENECDIENCHTSDYMVIFDITRVISLLIVISNRLFISKVQLRGLLR